MITDSDKTIIKKSRQESNMWQLTKMVQELYRRTMTNRENLVTLGDDYKAYVCFQLAIFFEDYCVIDKVLRTDITFEFRVRWSELNNDELPKLLSANIVDYLVEHCTGVVVPYWIKPVGIVKPK